MSNTIKRGEANLELLTSWLTNRINLHTKYSIEQEIRRGLRTCVTCVNFNKTAETCDLAAGQRPPAEVIAHGCDHYEDTYADIPF